MKIIKGIAALFVLSLVLKAVMFIIFNFETLLAIALVLGAWVGIFLFFDVVSGGWEESHRKKHQYDDFFKAQDKWNRRHRR